MLVTKATHASQTLILCNIKWFAVMRIVIRKHKYLFIYAQTQC